MEYFLLYKWQALIVLEIIAWTATVFMFYARYKLQSARLFKVGAVVTVLTGVIPQVLMGLLNYYLLAEVDLFTLIIVLLITYACTIGKKHVRLLDSWMSNKFAQKD